MFLQVKSQSNDPYYMLFEFSKHIAAAAAGLSLLQTAAVLVFIFRTCLLAPLHSSSEAITIFCTPLLWLVLQSF